MEHEHPIRDGTEGQPVRGRNLRRRLYTDPPGYRDRGLKREPERDPEKGPEKGSADPYGSQDPSGAPVFREDAAKTGKERRTGHHERTDEREIPSTRNENHHHPPERSPGRGIHGTAEPDARRRPAESRERTDGNGRLEFPGKRDGEEPGPAPQEWTGAATQPGETKFRENRGKPLERNSQAHRLPKQGTEEPQGRYGGSGGDSSGEQKQEQKSEKSARALSLRQESLRIPSPDPEKKNPCEEKEPPREKPEDPDQAGVGEEKAPAREKPEPPRNADAWKKRELTGEKPEVPRNGSARRKRELAQEKPEDPDPADDQEKKGPTQEKQESPGKTGAWEEKEPEGDRPEAPGKTGRETWDRVSAHSRRTENLHFSSEPGKAADKDPSPGKNQVPEHFRKENASGERKKREEKTTETDTAEKIPAGRKRAERKDAPGSGQGHPEPDRFLSGLGGDGAKKSHDGRLKRHGRKPSRRLCFDDEGNGMVRGAGMGMAGRAVSAATDTLAASAHEKKEGEEEGNAALEAARETQSAGGKTLRFIWNRAGHVRKKRMEKLKAASRNIRNTNLSPSREAEKSRGAEAVETAGKKAEAVRKFWKKQGYKNWYASFQRGGGEARGPVWQAHGPGRLLRRTISRMTGRNHGLFGIAAAVFAVFLVASACFSSCGAMMQGTASSLAGTTYPSTDRDIYATEEAYAAMERELNRKIQGLEYDRPGYDGYRYQIDEISHNPYHLISYFTAKYGEFTFLQVKEELREIFWLQYRLETDTVREMATETRTVPPGEFLGQVVTTGYCNCRLCCGQWAGGPTASGVYPTSGRTIAVDAFRPYVPMGTKVVMNGRTYVVEDTGSFGPRVQFDVYYDTHPWASAHGLRLWDAYLSYDNGRPVDLTETRMTERLDVTLTNHRLDAILRSRLTAEELARYDLYNFTFGNRNYLFNTDTLPGGTAGGFGYEIPAEALSDQRFARMIREAEKYLGYPYVWGGSSPATSFDCSGFVCWVIDHCGNGWNVGRRTADGLRGACAYVSPSQAKPGDLVFFQGTYHTPGASHVGIYVGNNMMIHCGNPIQYTSIAAPYWQQHLMAFGRLP